MEDYRPSRARRVYAEVVSSAWWVAWYAVGLTVGAVSEVVEWVRYRQTLPYPDPAPPEERGGGADIGDRCCPPRKKVSLNAEE